jgi:hypothetical protein
LRNIVMICLPTNFGHLVKPATAIYGEFIFSS